MPDLLDPSVILDGLTITESRPSEILAALHESAHTEREYLFATRDAEPDDLILVAWLSGEAVGYIAVTDERVDGVLVWEHLVVPSHRGYGIGERLLLEAARRAIPGAGIQIDPMAELDLDRIADYYRRLGFDRDRADGGIWATAVDVLRAADRRNGTTSETQTPVKMIIDGKTPGVVTVAPKATVRDAVDALNKHRIGAVVVSSDGSRIEGILSERDILIGIGEHGAAFLDQTITSITTTDVVTCTAHDSIASAMATMTRQRVRHLPVTSTGRLAGIVSIGDLVHYRLQEVEAAAADWLRETPSDSSF